MGPASMLNENALSVERDLITLFRLVWPNRCAVCELLQATKRLLCVRRAKSSSLSEFLLHNLVESSVLHTRAFGNARERSSLIRALTTPHAICESGGGYALRAHLSQI